MAPHQESAERRVGPYLPELQRPRCLPEVRRRRHGIPLARPLLQMRRCGPCAGLLDRLVLRVPTVTRLRRERRSRPLAPAGPVRREPWNRLRPRPDQLRPYQLRPPGLRPGLLQSCGLPVQNYQQPQSGQFPQWQRQAAEDQRPSPSWPRPAPTPHPRQLTEHRARFPPAPAGSRQDRQVAPWWFLLAFLRAHPPSVHRLR